MLKTEFFWTDYQQVVDRLYQSIILYDDEPHYVLRILEGDEASPTPRAEILPCGISKTEVKASRKILNSPKFERFRKLPNIGWMNFIKHPEVGALYLYRRPVAGSRSHGLTNTNTRVLEFGQNKTNFYLEQSNNFNLTSIMYDPGFVQMHKGSYPSLANILLNIKENSSIAYNNNFCVYRDDVGLRWLFFKTDKIGLFTGADTLNLFSKYSFLRETIMEDSTFTLNNIVEF